MKTIYEGHEFEAVKLQFKSQRELLYRLTMIDLRIFSGFITLQLALGAWLATKGVSLAIGLKLGMAIIDSSLAYVAIVLLYNNSRRRKEAVGTIRNCSKALGYIKAGVFLEDEPLLVDHKLRLWQKYYYIGISTTLIGVVLVLIYAS